jgi:Uri superfamily endonuclease
MKGAYVLIIRVRQPTILQIKSLGKIAFKDGIWVYVGSAMGDGSTSLENRLKRHFRKEKTIYWHIDYLLDTDSELVEAIWAESLKPVECELAQTIAASDVFEGGPSGFGASDCRKRCGAHIFFYQGHEDFQKKLFQLFRGLALNPNVTKNGQL